MGNGIAGIDHVIVAVRDLERARTAWSRLGFAVSPRGRHLGQPTANYCIMFPANYLELLGSSDAGDPAPRLEPFLARREGAMAVAFAPEGTAEEARAALLRRQLHPAEPNPLARQIELPQGNVVPRFSRVALPPDETPGLDTFVCGHLTPELMRRPEWLAHPNGANAVKCIYVLVDSTAPLLPAYDRLFGIVQVTTTDAVASVHVGRSRIVFSIEDDFRTMHPGLDLDAGFPRPGIVALELGVDRRERTKGELTQRQIAFAEMPDGRLAVPAREASGTILFFSEG